MLRAFRAPLVPTIILIGEIATAKWTPDWLVGVLIGFTLFWLVVSILGNKAIVRRLPWLREWVPFLDPSGGLATEAELLNTHIQGKAFRLVDIAPYGVVENRTFDDCIIYGPAVVAAQEYTAMRQPKWNSRRGDIWYQIDDAKERAGMIMLKNCTFNRCTLHDIGIAGDDRDKFFSGMTEEINSSV